MVNSQAARQNWLGLQLVWVWLGFLSRIPGGLADDCKLMPVIHTLHIAGCNSITIPSLGCIGKCTSYVQVSGSKLWQTERSCMCCQESGEREATVTLPCPNAPPGSPRFQKVVTKAPVDCMCRPCTTLDEGSILPQEMAGYLNTDGTPQYASMFRRIRL